MSGCAVDDIPLLAILPDEARERLAKVSSRRRFRKDELVIEEGAVAASLFCVVSGTAQVTQDGEVVNEVGEGDFFGEIGTLPNDEVRWPRRTATVTATSPLDLLAIPDREVHSLVEDFKSFGDLLRSAADARAPR
jgi:CRP-like cAMP-binding protein